MTYCPDGLQVYYATETQQYNYAQIYGHYELQPIDVNGRPYFKKASYFELIENNVEIIESYGFWYDGLGYWWIGFDSEKGQSIGAASYVKDVFCPHQLSDFNWLLLDGNDWYTAGDGLGIKCKCIFIQNKTKSEFHSKKMIFHDILGSFGSCTDITAGDVVILDKDEEFVRSEFEKINLFWHDFMKSMLGNKYTIIVSTFGSDVVPLPSPDGSPNDIWYFPRTVVTKICSKLIRADV